MSITYSMTIGAEPFVPAKNYDCATLANWSVTYGRTDPDTQPDPGRGQWTIITSGADRGPDIFPGCLVVFTANVDGTTLPVATMIVSEVRRDFGWVGGVQRNTLTVNAEGVTVALNRALMDDQDYLVPPLVTDGQRVSDVIGNRLQKNIGRSTHTHIVNADSTDIAGNPRLVVSESWAEFSQKYRPPVYRYGYFADVEVTFTADAAVDVGFRFGGGAWGPTTWQFMQPGTHRLQFEFPVDGSSELGDPRFRFRAESHGSVVWSQATGMGPRWQDPAMRWDAIGGHAEANVQIVGMDVWMDGWNWGTDLVEVRNPSSQEQAASEKRLDYIKSIGTAFRAALWEMRDGTVFWQTRWSRSLFSQPEVTVDACDVMAVATSTSNLSQIVNQVKAFWGLPDSAGNRPEKIVKDTVSQTWFGTQEWPNDGPVHDEATAQQIADWVILSHKDPHEDLPSLSLLPFEKLSPLLVADLLRLSPGSLLELVDTPSGWLTSPRWLGFVEGTTITGTRDSDGGQRTVMELAVSDYRSVTGQPPPPPPVHLPTPLGVVEVTGADWP